MRIAQQVPWAHYCPFYCEENVWHLCAAPRLAAAERRVLFISNRGRQVVIWGQRLAPRPELPVAWDYHVVLLLRPPADRWQVLDLDGRQPQPRPAEDWLAGSFPPTVAVPERLRPRFRLVDAELYRRHLRSDRRHMRHHDGRYLRPPPPWAPICGEPLGDDSGSNLARFVDTEDTDFVGNCFDLPDLRAWLAQPHAPSPARGD